MATLFKDYVTSLGFEGVDRAKTAKDPNQIRAFVYESFDTAQVRHTLGRAKAHRPGLMVFVLRTGRAVRVDTTRKIILLGNGKKAVQALLRTVNKPKRK